MAGPTSTRWVAKSTVVVLISARGRECDHWLGRERRGKRSLELAAAPPIHSGRRLKEPPHLSAAEFGRDCDQEKGMSVCKAWGMV